MRLLWLFIPVLIVLNGCSEAPKRVSVPKQKVVKKVVKKPIVKKDTSKKYLGNNIYFVKDTITDSVIKKMLRFIDVKKMSNLVRKRQYKQKFEVTSFDINEAKNEYYVGGNYEYEEKKYFHNGVKFVAIYDTKNLAYKGMYYIKKYTGEFKLSDGRYALFKHYKGATVVDMQKKRSIKLAFEKNQRIGGYQQRAVFSQDGKYVAAIIYRKYTNEPTPKLGYITVFSLKDGSVVSKYIANISGLGVGYAFSKDSKFVANSSRGHKVYVKSFSGKHIKVFGQGLDSKYARSYIENFGNYFIIQKNIPTKSNSRYDEKTYVYDIPNHKLICTIDESSEQRFLDTKNMLLYLNNSKNQRVYKVYKNSCINIDEKSIKLPIPLWKGKYKENMMAKIRNRFYGFDNGKVIYVDAREQSYSKEYISALTKLQKAQKYFKVGFEDKGYATLKEFIFNPKFDFFKEKRSMLYKSIKKPLQRAFILANAYQRYKKEKLLTQNNDAFAISMIDYIVLASEAKFYDLSYAMTQELKKEWMKSPQGLNETNIQSIKLFEANYLLSIGKEKEAYTLLFEIQPVTKGALSFLKAYAHRDIALMHNKSKLAVALDIDEDILKPKVKKVKGFSKFFNLEGQLVSRDYIPNKKIESSTQVTPKNNAIKLLD